MSDTNYEDILNTSWDAIPEKQALPGGSWLLRGKGAKYFPPAGEANARVMFIYGAKEPMNDVNGDELAELASIGYEVSQNKIFFTIWGEDDGNLDWDAVRKHLEKHGVETKGKNVTNSLKEFRGKEIVAFLDTRTYQNKAGDTVTENTAGNFVKPE